MTLRLLALLGLAALLAPPPAHAQIQQARQAVFGMDCSPCAYALERRLGRLDGVEGVTVSLNDAEAVVRLRGANDALLGALREAVREAGFDPRATTLRVAGTLRQTGGRWELVTPAGERFHVASAASGAREALQAQDGRRVVVTGRVGEGPPSARGWVLTRAALAS
ncbi:heavy-metal-associated domain-containing protein [Rubrivirga marina]|jgi:copper chaperone CopZ|uniref:HMA domain-containing protein n=1 Tax=Rubrivirga marina TaxID=1196024 RepID=A0A271ITH1_9BACT|nr:heavy-metal-associated domain-containing protein [Rubrivirga marina]PAP74526.1 hypothetical protein BSZ37_20290 [Rubrivirga marina]